LSKPV